MLQTQPNCIFEQKKTLFLSSLHSQGRWRYKRYLGSPIRYAGGKSLAVGLVLEQLPKVSRVISPFIGGGSIEIAIAKELNIPVYGYDIFEELCNYWQIQLKTPVELAELISSWGCSAQQYLDVKQRLKQHWTKRQLIADPAELAAHYWYNHNLSYGPGFLGWMSKIYQEPKRFSQLVSKVQNFSAPQLSVQPGSFPEVIPEYKNDFLYLDPPYYLDGDSKMFKGIYPQRNFPVHHRGFDHQLLAQLLHTHCGGFILSYNDCQYIRDLYKKYTIKRVNWQYTLGQGETRIGSNRLKDTQKEIGQKHVKQSHEILILKT